MRAFDEYNPPAYNLDVYSEVLLGFQVYDGLVYTEYQMTASEVSFKPLDIITEYEILFSAGTIYMKPFQTSGRGSRRFSENGDDDNQLNSYSKGKS